MQTIERSSSRRRSYFVRERNGEGGEMPLQTSVNVESTRILIHREYELTIANLFQGELLSIVPMLIVEIFADDRVRLDRIELIAFRHVEVV
jgi:hypothetical protein